MPAATYNIKIEQGATFELTATYTDSAGAAIDITGYSARMQVRRTKNSSTTLLDLTSVSGITITGASGLLEIVASATLTAAITGTVGVYDLEIESAGGVVTRLLEGAVEISKEVTR